MAVREIQVFKLGVEAQFERLTAREKRYAHHMAR
jgi:dipeptidyl-peptidase-3